MHYGIQSGLLETRGQLPPTVTALPYMSLCPNRSVVQGLGGAGGLRGVKYFDSEAYRQQWYIRIFKVTGPTWTFVYKEVAICAYAAAKRTRILLELYCFLKIFLCFIRTLVCICPLTYMWCVCEGPVRLLGTALLLGHMRYYR